MAEKVVFKIGKLGILDELPNCDVEGACQFETLRKWSII